MNRLFGAKSNTPKPTLTSAIAGVDERISTLDVKLSALTAELSSYQSKLSKMRDGPGKTALRSKALKVLQRRKLLESQREQLAAQSFNMEQAGMMTDNVKNVMTTVDALKTTQKTLRKQYGRIDVDKIERLQDEMSDLMDLGNEIQESLGRGYEVPEGVDEDELDAELEALGEEVEFEREMGLASGQGVGETPGFLVDEVPTFIDEPVQKTGQVKEAAG